MKGKGEKEKYTHLNAEFQRIAKREKKAFLNEQSKEIAESIRMGKTLEDLERSWRDLFKKIKDTKGTFYAKMSTIKDRNGMDLTKQRTIQKDLHDPDNHNSVITHLEPDILVGEVKWFLESISTNKACGGDAIPAELLQTLKGDAVKVLHSICQQIWKTQQWPQGWKKSVFIPIPKKGNAKEYSNCCTIAFISQVSKIMFKIL